MGVLVCIGTGIRYDALQNHIAFSFCARCWACAGQKYSNSVLIKRDVLLFFCTCSGSSVVASKTVSLKEAGSSPLKKFKFFPW